MKITTGGLEVLESGVVNSMALQDIEFNVSEAPRMTIAVRVLKTDDGKAGAEFKVESNEKAVFVFSNPDSINYGPSEPVEIGTLRGRKLFAMVRVNVMGELSSFMVHYTFYLGGAA